MRRRINGTYITHLTPALITHSVRYLLWFRTAANQFANNPNHQLLAQIKTRYCYCLQWDSFLRFHREIWSNLTGVSFMFAKQAPWIIAVFSRTIGHLFFSCWFVTEMIACQMDPTFIAHNFAGYLRLTALCSCKCCFEWLFCIPVHIFVKRGILKWIVTVLDADWLIQHSRYNKQYSKGYWLFLLAEWWHWMNLPNERF